MPGSTVHLLDIHPCIIYDEMVPMDAVNGHNDIAGEMRSVHEKKVMLILYNFSLFGVSTKFSLLRAEPR